LYELQMRSRSRVRCAIVSGEFAKVSGGTRFAVLGTGMRLYYQLEVRGQIANGNVATQRPDPLLPQPERPNPSKPPVRPPDPQPPFREPQHPPHPSQPPPAGDPPERHPVTRNSIVSESALASFADPHLQDVHSTHQRRRMEIGHVGSTLSSLYLHDGTALAVNSGGIQR
jgi:hypothetical protein